jgi:hypothetical protein
MAPVHNTTRLDLAVEPVGGNACKPGAAALRVLALERLTPDTTVRTLRVDVEPEQLKFCVGAHAPRMNPRDLAFEPLTLDGRASLLLQCPSGSRVRVNGSPAGRLSVLFEGDQLQLEDAVLHVVKFVEFHVGPPSGEQIGRICGVCRAPIGAGPVGCIEGASTYSSIHPEGCRPMRASSRISSASAASRKPSCTACAVAVAKRSRCSSGPPG